MAIESTMSCLVSLFYYTSDVHYLRLMNKFNEMNFEKVHRLKDVLLLFLDRVNSIHDDELGEEELYLMRLDAVNMFHQH